MSAPDPEVVNFGNHSLGVIKRTRFEIKELLFEALELVGDDQDELKQLLAQALDRIETLR